MTHFPQRLTMVAAGMAFVAGIVSAQVREEYDEAKMRQAEAARFVALMKALREPASGSRDYDVTYYRLDLRIDTNPTRISGSVEIRMFSRSDALSTVTLDLSSAMTVDSVFVDGSSQSFVQDALTFDTDLGTTRPNGSSFTMMVYYHGMPATTGFGSFASTVAPDGSPWIWTLSEPYGARDWWPCNDHPTDKADSLDVLLTVPGTLKAGSQGLLDSALSNPDGTTTYHWKHRYPIATYLVSLAIANYDVYTYWYRYSPTDSMQILNYLLPGTGVGSLPLTAEMIRIYSEMFGPYPFLAEKYGHAQFGWGGAMEHQTMTSTGSTGEAIIGHELAHQWFGDMITLAGWPHIWLNEGFATYGEVLYEEQRYGEGAYATAMTYRKSSAMGATTSLYVSDTTDIGTLFSNSLVYSKGACVLHMLRHVVGDSLFFAGMKAYATDPRFDYGTATTEDFRDVFEAVTGTDLHYFFNEWVYGENYPQYVYSWGTTPQGGSTLVTVEIAQSTGTANPTFFTMPVDLKIVGLSSDTTVVVFNDQPVQLFTITVPVAPTNVVLDPDGWILKSATGLQVAIKDGRIEPVQFELEQNFPNPFNAGTTVRFGLGSRSDIAIEVFDILGRRISVILEDTRDAGFYSATWNQNVPTGTYVLRLKATPTDGSGATFTQSRTMMVLR